MRTWLLAAVLWCSALPVQAQLTAMREHERQMDSGRLALGADINTFFGNVDSAGYAFVQPTLMTAFRVYEVVIEAALPFAYFHENNDPGADHDQFALGNPWFALAFLPDTSCGLSRVSLGIAPDLMPAHDARDRRALSLARAANGDWDGYLWVDRALPLVLGASTLKEKGMLHLGWDADLILGLPGGGRDVEFGAQTAGELGLLFGWRTSLGARLSGAYYPTFDGDQFQSALSFYLRYLRTDDSFGLRFVMNLDGPAGFSFADDGVWGLGLSYTASVF